MNHHKIRRLKVTGGFLDGVNIEFADGLNCIIGARGTGKTTIQELLRFALERGPKSITSELVKANLELMGSVEVEFESQEGMVFRVRRSQGQDPVITDATGEAVDGSVLESGILIDAAIFSQNQIEDIAATPAMQRELLDRFRAKELAALKQKLQHLRQSLRQNAQEILSLEHQRQDLEFQGADLTSLEQRLAALNMELDQERIEPRVHAHSEAKRTRDKEREVLSSFGPLLNRLRSTLTPLEQEVVRAGATGIPEALLQGPRGELFSELTSELRHQVAQLEHSVTGAANALTGIEDALEKAVSEFQAAAATEDADYQSVLLEAKARGQKIAQRDQVAKEVLQIQSIGAEIGRIAQMQKRAREARVKLCQEYTEALDQRYTLRKQAADELNERLAGTIRVSVAQAADGEDYTKFLLSRMEGSGKQYTVGVPKITSAVPPAVLAEMVVSDQPRRLADESGIKAHLAEAVLAALKSKPEDVFELETLPVNDGVTFDLKVGAHWKPTTQLSTGQRCSAILPILLHEAVTPLLIDQPEDNLDNSYVSDTVVPQLRRAKEARQMIFNTHNPNIPVLAEADHVVVLKSEGSKAEIAGQGSVDEMKTAIQNLLEGGKRAFEQRRRRYGK